MELPDVLIVVNGKRIRVEDVIVNLKVTGAFRDEVCRMVETEVLKKKAKELGLKITEEEHFEFAGSKRRYWGLSRAEEMNEYCRSNGITMEQWQESTKHELLRTKIRDKVVEDRVIQDYFNGHRETMKAVSLSRIVCESREDAEKLKERVLNKGENFSELARKHSLEQNTRIAGGYLGTVRRGMLPQKVDEALFSAQVADLLGPFGENGLWSLYKVDAVRDPELNEVTKKDIADRLFAVWLQRAIDESLFERPK